MIIIIIIIIINNGLTMALLNRSSAAPYKVFLIQMRSLYCRKCYVSSVTLRCLENGRVFHFTMSVVRDPNWGRKDPCEFRTIVLPEMWRRITACKDRPASGWASDGQTPVSLYSGIEVIVATEGTCSEEEAACYQKSANQSPGLGAVASHANMAATAYSRRFMSE